MIPVIISGASGRMGQALLSCIKEDEGFELVGCLERDDHPLIGKVVDLSSGIVLESDLARVEAKKAVVVDFSTPTAAMSLIAAAASKSFPLVIGTTGFSTAEKKVIEDASELVAIVLSPNMSIGTNLLFKLVRETAAILGDAYDAEIIEAHHRFKRDAPSGTAKRLAQIISKVYEKDVDVVATHGRKGDHLERKPNEIGIHSIRAGDIVAEHTVLFSTLGERLELTHRVHNRITFARGALLAARFAFTALPGLYDMQDVLDMST